MKTRFGLILSLSLGLFSAGAAQASDAALGAIVGGGLGAVIGHQVGGHNSTVIGGFIGAATGAIIASDNGHRTYRRDTYYYAPTPVHYAPAPVYAPAPAYRSTTVYYRNPPVVRHLPPPPSRNYGRNGRPGGMHRR
jgi:hypothetical protein